MSGLIARASMLGILLLCTTAHAQESFELVKNKQNPIASLTPTEVRNLYTGKTSAFPTGTVQLVFCKANMAGPTWLAEKVLDVPVATLFTKIRQEVFRERMNKPVLADTDAAVLEAVKNNPAALGIVAKVPDGQLPKEVAFVPIVGEGTP